MSWRSLAFALASVTLALLPRQGTAAEAAPLPSGIAGLAAPSGMSGMSGQEGKSFVREVQRMLAKAGYFEAREADGRLGPKTRDAIIKFQKANGLKPDGRMTPELYALLSQKTR
jgi:peptidoglycan hydrolase-like protein with peptidoglycan-binding domain